MSQFWGREYTFQGLTFRGAERCFFAARFQSRGVKSGVTPRRPRRFAAPARNFDESAFGTFFSFFPRPAFLYELAPSRYCERIFGHVNGDARGRSYIRAFSDAHRGNQRTVASNKDVIGNNRLMLVDSVVVARDRPCPNVHSRADLGISQVREVVCLGALPELDLFGFHKIAHVSPFSDVCLRT